MFARDMVHRDYGDVILLHQKENRTFFLFEDTAADIVRGLLRGRSPMAIADKMVNEYQIPPGTNVADDVRAFIQTLTNEGVLKTDDSEAPQGCRSSEEEVLGAAASAVMPTGEEEICDYCASHLIPYSATWELTFGCNLRCVHCYCPPDGELFWTLDRVAACLEELKALGTVDIEFTGGECFFHPDIDRILELTASQGFVFALLTNGLALTQDRVDRIASLHPRCVQLSIYSLDEDVHDGITRVRGSLRRTLAALEALLNAGVRTHIACTLLKRNALDARKLADWAAERGVPVLFGFKLTHSENSNRHPERERVDTSVLRDLLRDPRINPVTRASEKARLSKPWREGAICQGGFRNLALSAVGEVFPCNSLRLCAGLVSQNALSVIWFNSPVLRRWREITIDDFPECRACSAKSLCNPCPAGHHAETGDLTRIHAADCRIGMLYYESLQELGLSARQ